MNILRQNHGWMQFTLEGESEVFECSQKIDVHPYFTEFLVEERFNTIIEIGTYKGGFALILDYIRNTRDLHFDFHTFDISSNYPISAYHKRPNIKFHLQDCFDNGGFVISDLILNGGKVLLLCDGGNKINEFNFFSDIIKPNDFIMAHDYSHDGSNHGWDWQEITLRDIQQSIDRNRLVPYEKQNFQNVVWACYEKPNLVYKI